MGNNGILMDIFSIAIQGGIVAAIAIAALIFMSKGHDGDEFDDDDSSDNNE